MIFNFYQNVVIGTRCTLFLRKKVKQNKEAKMYKTKVLKKPSINYRGNLTPKRW